MRLLVAEDDAALRARLASALADAGFAVDAVADGTGAEFLGQTEEFDAAVLDLGLPGMDGLSVLSRWREAGRGFPVLVLTARARWHDKLAGFNSGADDYLTKPFQLEELILRLRALIRRSAGHAHPRLACGPLELDANGRLLIPKPLMSYARLEKDIVFTGMGDRIEIWSEALHKGALGGNVDFKSLAAKVMGGKPQADDR